ncbi:MAG: class I tRNA ligase family protein, partial [Dehalococcoidia bacterium]|nr:class I tRNA ligase family protein [Dehalococcoidia bacterium]
ELTARIGFWIDIDNPYITLDNNYIETCWWILKNFWDKGLIYKGHRVTPHCPRCGTSLSSHEVSLGYKDDTPDPSVYVKFKIKDFSPDTSPALRKLLSSQEPAYLLAWTTTPWTLPGNVALALLPSTNYAVVEISTEAGKEDTQPSGQAGRLSYRDGKERLILCEALVSKVIRGEYCLLGTFPGSQLLVLKYEPLYNPQDYEVPLSRFSGKGKDLKPVSGREEPLLYPVIGGDFVSLEEGTGIVHIAPAFGEVDYDAGVNEGLHFVQQVDNRGIITGKYKFAGKFVKNADPVIEKDLKERGLLYYWETIHHTYPFCWRCQTPLLYYAKASWYIRTSALKEKLIAGNEEINWYPEHIKHGRFGDWLRNNVDWALSRERYWGTPLPIWHCPACKKHECMGSLTEIKEKAHSEAMKAQGLNAVESLKDLHRPYIDEVLLRCPECGGPMKREPEVIDC